MEIVQKAAWQKAYRESKIAAGICHCFKPLNRGKECDDCLDARRDRATILRSSRTVLGLCSHCGVEPRLKTNKRCKTCNEKHKVSHTRLKELTLSKYGSVCGCCGEADSTFLSIDHINNDGAQHRRELESENVSSGESFYRWLRRQDWPKGYQTLCFNCNHGRFINGGICPHEEIRPYATQGVKFDMPSTTSFLLPIEESQSQVL